MKRGTRVKRLIFLVLGCVTLTLGCVGLALPILPSVPFFLVTLFSFSQSSQKLRDWFISTRLYRENLASYAQRKGMRLRAKLSVMASVTAVMAVSFVFMGAVPVGRIILCLVWAGHLIYFLFRVKTLPEKPGIPREEGAAPQSLEADES